MREIFIKYNPYRMETEVAIDEKPVKRDSSLHVEDRRLQEWIEDLPKILKEECNTNSFHITFHGTMLDYEDLLSVVEEAKTQGFVFECEHIPAKEVKDKEQAIEEIFAEIQAGPFDELREPDILKAFRNAQSSEFPVNVVATVSAGKSTLINALLRQKLMPAMQQACTATITEIKDSDNESYRAVVYDESDTLLEVHNELNLATMEYLNKNPDVALIHVEGKIPFVNAADVALVLVDAPGTNNSRDPQHKVATERMLSKSSKTLILYILNATQLAVNDDDDLLSSVANSIKVGGRQSKDRFLFVVNKLDNFRSGEDSVGDSIEKVRNYLEDKGIKNPNIYPASALTALDIRTILKDRKVVGYTEEELDELDPVVFEIVSKVKKINQDAELHLEQYAPLTPSVKAKISAGLAQAEQMASRDTQDAATRSEGMKQLALIHSGVVAIEEAIQMYVLKYAKTAKIKNIVDTFSTKLESQKSFENVRQEIAANQEKQQEIQAQIAAIQEKLKNGAEAKKFKDRIDTIDYGGEIRRVANDVIKDAQKEIEKQCSSCEEKLTKINAEYKCLEFVKFAEGLQAKVQVKLEQIITDHVEKNAAQLLAQYRQHLEDLSRELCVGAIRINPFEMMSGDIAKLSDSAAVIASIVKSERVEVGSHRRKNKDKKWYNPFTWFEPSHYTVTDYENREYVDGSELAKRFFAPIQKQLYDNSDSAVAYAKEQTQQIKTHFKAEFKKLDDVLNAKLAELQRCAADEQDVQKVIAETESRLNWLENIQHKIMEILDI